MKQYTFPQSRIQDLLRTLTRETPLSYYENTRVGLGVSFRMDDLDLPDEYFTIAGHMPFGKMPDWLLDPSVKLCVAHHRHYFDITENDPRFRGVHRLRAPELQYEAPYAGEILSFGTGLLLPKYQPTTSFTSAIATPGERRSRTGIRSKGFQSHGTIVQQTGLVLREDNEQEDTYVMEPWESTNIIPGDAYGELEQLANATPKLLDAYAAMLSRRLGSWSSMERRRIGVPQTYGMLAYNQLTAAHLDLQLEWDSPPKTDAELKERVDAILTNIIPTTGWEM